MYQKSETKLKMMDSEQEDEIFRSLGYDENDKFIVAGKKKTKRWRVCFNLHILKS